MGIETALLIGGGLSAGASIYSGNKAADAAEKGAQQAADVQRYMYDTTRRDLEPYRQTGQQALSQLASLYGIQNPMSYEQFTAQNPVTIDNESGQIVDQGMAIPGRAASRIFGNSAFRSGRFGALMDNLESKVSAQPDMQGEYQKYLASFQPSASGPDYSGFYNSPDYKFAYDEGMKSVEQSLARRGLSDSGAAMKSLTRFGQGLASQQLGNYKNQLAALAGIGQSTSTNLGQFGANAAANMGNAYQSAADSRASSYLNTGSAISGAANQYGQYQLLKAGGYI